MNQDTPKKSISSHTPRLIPYQTRPYLNFHVANPQSMGQTPYMVDEIYEQVQHNEQGGIYGTNIETSKVITTITQFIEQFEKESQTNQGQTQRIYRNKLNDLDLDIFENYVFEIDGKDIKQFDVDLYHQIIFFPVEMITLFDQTLKNLYQRHYVDTEENQSIRQLKNHKKQALMFGIKRLSDSNVMLMRSLQSRHINRLISFKGIVIRCSDIYPQMKTAVFRCINKNCKNQIEVLLQNAKVQQPKQCKHCKMSDSFEVIHNLCNFTDKQYIKIQELPQFVLQGQTPASTTILCYDTNVNSMRPGDRVEIVGIFRCQPKKVNRTRTTTETVFHTYTDLISFKALEQNRLNAADKKLQFSSEDKQKIFQIGSRPNVIDELVDSFASSIYGHENIKKGLLAQIFGGTCKEFQGRGRFRSDINICLVGDPSTAKSQLLKQVHKIAPRGIYTSGKGSSAVGLTANIRKDPETRQFILESGALVLSDLGICCIDEFDKMDQNSKLILLQAMQQQTISIAKAGIVCQLNSRTSILSAANPILSKYDSKRSVVQNIHLPPALLSRFDLIYIILDIPNLKLDTKLAKHILSIYSGKPIQESKLPKIDRSLLTKYISWSKQYIHPKISQAAGKQMVSCYKQMRKIGSHKSVTATPRQLESLIRISQAFAKMKLSQHVAVEDVNLAYELIKDALQQSATDPETGLIDMDLLVTGHSSGSRKRVDAIINIMNNLFKANASDFIGKKIAFQKTMEYIQDHWNENETQIKPRAQDAIQALNKLQKQGVISVFGHDRKAKPQFKYLNSESN